MIEPAPGVLLIADPFLKDPNFLRTVVFLCEHQAEGSFGFTLNRLSESNLGELIPELEGHHFPVFIGGPVSMNSLHFLHQYPDLIPGSQEVIKGVWWGGDFDAVKAHILNGSIRPAKIRFFAGYSGWGENQLSDEIGEKTWLTVTATRKLVFLPNHQEIWKEALLSLGGDFKLMVNFPIDPQLN